MANQTRPRTSTRHRKRSLTIMFTDISGFTRQTEVISRDELMKRIETYNELLTPVIAHFEGNIVKTMGDAFLITFESPTNAVRCGLLMQHKLREYNTGKPEPEQFLIKVAITAGEVVETDNDVFGDPVNVAAKIEKATKPGDIYFTEAVFHSMHKAEVPNAFVKGFRPRGEESAEIKLYKVIQDENDETYRKIVDETQIDTDRVRTRVIELANVAEKEAVRYQDTLEQVLAQHGRASSQTINRAVGTIALAIVIAAALVGGGLFYALSQSTGAPQSPEQQAISDARAFLASGNIERARGVLDAHVRDHGKSDAVEDALSEVAEEEKRLAEAEALRQRERIITDARTYLAGDKPAEARGLLRNFIDANGPNAEIQEVLDEVRRHEVERAAKLAKELLAEGYPADARLEIEKALDGDEPQTRERLILERCAAYEDAREFVSEGQGAEAVALIEKVFGEVDPGDDFRNLRARAGALADAPVLLEGKDAGGNALTVLEMLASAFGDDTRHPAARDWIARSLRIELYEYARREGKQAAANRLEEFRRRFVSVPNWAEIERESRLGALYFYTKPGERMRWKQGAYETEVWDLDREAEGDPLFLWRLGAVLYEISLLMNTLTLDGAWQWSKALELDPALAERHNKELVERMVHALQVSQSHDSFIRDMVRRYCYEGARPHLIEGLLSTDEDVRINSFALLADAGEPEVVKDLAGFFLKDFHRIVSSQALSREALRTVFACEFEYNDYRLIRRTIEDALAECETGGRYSAYRAVPPYVRDMFADLKEAQPAHTARYAVDEERSEDEESGD